MKNHPLWYKNLVKTPEVKVQIGGELTSHLASTADASERAKLWPRLVEMYRDYDTYQTWTDRVIPVVILTPSGGDGKA
jgi:deazaflavin-dependent oxidoreductase (nitroreductase family)